MSNSKKTIFWVAKDKDNKVAIYIDNNYKLTPSGEIKLTEEAENVTVDCVKATAHVLSQIKGNEITFKYGDSIFILNATILEATEKNMKKYFPKGKYNLNK